MSSADSKDTRPCPDCGNEYQRVYQHISMSDCEKPSICTDDKEILRGLLLGDGYITRRDVDTPRFGIDMTNLEFLEWLSDTLDVKTNGPQTVAEEHTGEWYDLERTDENSEFKEQYRLTVTCHEDLNDLSEWYGDNGKRFPDPLDLSLMELKMWYVSDGSLNGDNISIACLNERDNKENIERALEDLGVSDITWYDSECATSLHIGKEDTRQLFKLMGNPPPGFYYKWPEDAVIQDDHGEYEMDRGSPHPVDPDNYDACNAVLRYTWLRYGERRYCTALSVSNFTKHDVETDYEYDHLCKNHQMRGSNMERHEDQLTTGAYTKSHEHLFQHLPPHKQLIANDLYRSLLGESTYDFDTETHELRIDVSDKDFAGPETDTVVLDHPIPTQKEIRAKALWYAALDFMKMESIGQEQFRVAAEEDHDGRELAIGERTTYVATDDDFKEVVEEHHLNLPLSRIIGNYEKHMKFGGVSYDGNEEAVGEMSTHDWVAVVEADEEEMQPESKRSESSPLTDIEVSGGED